MINQNAHAIACAKYRIAHPDRIKASQEKFKITHPERSVEIKEKYRKSHPEQYANYSSQRREKHPEQVVAQHKVSHAIRDGKMERGTHCSSCGFEGKVEAHHYLGYEPEHWFDVVWLCHKCHSIADRKE